MWMEVEKLAKGVDGPDHARCHILAVQERIGLIAHGDAIVPVFAEKNEGGDRIATTSVRSCPL